MIEANKAYRTVGGHVYHVTAVVRAYNAATDTEEQRVTFEARCGGSSWGETWPLARFMAAVEREPVEPQPAPARRFTQEQAFLLAMRYKASSPGALYLIDRIIDALRELDAQPPAPAPTNAESTFSGLSIPGPPELRAESLRDSYQKIAWEIEGLAQLAGGTDPDDDVCDALAHLACAMKSLTAARDKALAEWVADGGAEPEPGCRYFATGVPISVGAPPEPDGLESALQKLGARARGAAAAKQAQAAASEEEHEPECGCFACVTAVPLRTYGPLGRAKEDDLEEQRRERDLATRVYGRLGYEKIDRATGAVPGERRLDPETFQEVEEAVDRALRHVEPEEGP